MKTNCWRELRRASALSLRRDGDGAARSRSVAPTGTSWLLAAPTRLRRHLVPVPALRMVGVEAAGSLGA